MYEIDQHIEDHEALGVGRAITDATIVTTDVTTNNASTTKHGWFPKLPTASGLFLKDDLTWAAAGGGGDFNVDGGAADTVYGAITAIDGGTA